MQVYVKSKLIVETIGIKPTTKTLQVSFAINGTCVPIKNSLGSKSRTYDIHLIRVALYRAELYRELKTGASFLLD